MTPTHGDGYGHVAFTVDDLDAEHARFESLGLKPNPIKAFHRDGTLMACFFFVQDPDGYKIEMLQRHGRYTQSRRRHGLRRVRGGPTLPPVDSGGGATETRRPLS